MQRLLFFLFAFSVANFSFAQTWQWAKSAGGSGNDVGTSVATDAWGNVYALGSFQSATITFGGTVLTNAGSDDIYFVKYNAAGTVMWAKRIGGSGQDNPGQITTDAAGNVYFDGTFTSSTLTIGSTILSCVGSYDIFLAKYDSAGNVKWAKSAGGSGQEGVANIAVDGAGNVLISGFFLSSSMNFGSLFLPHSGDDIFFAKYDSSGNALWAKNPGGSGWAEAPGLAADASGNVYVAGHWNGSSISFGTTTLINAGGYDMYVAKYSASGAFIWAERAGNTGDEFAYSLTIDVSGKIYVTGNYTSSSLGFGSTTLTNAGVSNFYMTKYDTSGTVIWAKTKGGSGTDNAGPITSDANCNLYTTGAFGSPTLIFGTTTLTNAGGSDIYLAKFDSSGNALWAKSAGGAGADGAYDLANNASGSIYITGSFGSSSIAFGTTTLINAGSNDMFLAKINDTCATLTAGTITGSPTVTIGYPVTFTDTASGGVWSSGNTSIAIIGSTGIVTGVTAGTVNISYSITNSCGTVYATKTVTVSCGGGSGGIITTIAGNGSSGYSGDGGPATAAVLSLGNDVIVDNAGNIYFSDHGNHRIRKINTSGVITTIAGNGSSGYSGDGGPATDASLFYPCGVAVDVAGNVFIADRDNYRIRKVNTSGIISTFAGNGIWSFSGDGGAATLASLGRPTDVTIDLSGNVYIADNNNNRIRKVNTAGVISTYAGNGSGTYSGDGGPATTASLNGPTSVSVDASGNVIIADQNNARVRKVSTSGIITNLAGNGIGGYSGDGGAATLAELIPTGLALDGTGNIYISDGGNNRVRMINSSGIISTIAGNGTAGFSGDGGPATAASLNVVIGVALDASGNIYFADLNNERIRKISASFSIPAIAGPSTVCVGNSITLSDSTSGGTWSSNNTAVATVGSAGIVTGLSTGTATISYTKTNSCGSVVATKTITVNPIPALSSSISPATICNGTLFNYVPASTVPGTTFTWSRAAVAGISNLAATGTGNINETLTNTTASPVIVTYVYTLNASGCSNTQNITVVVNPMPVLASSLTPPPVCSGTLFSYSPASTTTGVAFTWSRSATAGISNPAAIGAGNISEVLVNTTTSPVSVTYNYSLNAYGCINAQNVTVTVNPLPNAGTITGAVTLCTGAATSYTDASPGGFWSSANGNASLSGAGIVTGISSGTDTIEYIVVNACGTAIASKPVTVNSSPSAGTVTGVSAVCAGSTVPLTDVATGGTWSSLSTAIATVGSSGIVSGVSAGSATIIYTVTNTCGSAVASHIITVNPLPVAGTITGLSTVCTGSNITLTDASPGGLWSATNGNAFVSSGGIADGITAGTDTIKYIVTNACGTTSASKTITINPLPNAGTISGLSSVCPTASVTLTDGVPGGTWSAVNGHATVLSGVVTGVTAGTDTIQYTVSNSCGTVSTSQIIAVNSLPVSGTIAGVAAICVGNESTLTESISGGAWSAANTNALVSTGGIVYAMSAGVDTINYTVTNSCGSATAIHAITINPLPNAGTISGSSTVCIGTPDTLSDPVPGGSWTATNTNATVTGGIIAGIAAGADTIVYTVSNTCGTASKSKIISINAMPNAGVITGKDTVCMETTIVLTESVTGGSWSTATGKATVSTTGVVIGVNNGSDTVLYTVSNSCGTAVAKMPLQVLQQGDCVSGVGIPGQDATLALIPNPNKGVFTLKGTMGSTTDEQVSIEVIDILGQVVYRSKIMKENGKLDERVDLGNSLANGMYLLSLRSDSAYKVFHVVKAE